MCYYFIEGVGSSRRGLVEYQWGGVNSSMTLSAEKFPSDTVKKTMNAGLVFFVVMMIN